MRLCRLLGGCILMTCLSVICSCAPKTYRLYSGKPLPPDKIAVLVNRVDSFYSFGASGVCILRILSVDSHDLGLQAPAESPHQRIELMPGPCTVTAYLRGGLSRCTSAFGVSTYESVGIYGPPHKITFTTEPGCTYEIGYRLKEKPVAGKPWKWEPIVKQLHK